jgi:hypothetical protein
MTRFVNGTKIRVIAENSRHLGKLGRVINPPSHRTHNMEKSAKMPLIVSLEDHAESFLFFTDEVELVETNGRGGN